MDFEMNGVKLRYNSATGETYIKEGDRYLYCGSIRRDESWTDEQLEKEIYWAATDYYSEDEEGDE